MSAYTTLEVTPEFARAFLIGKIMTASNEELGDMMDVYGDENPYLLNNFRCVEELPDGES